MDQMERYIENHIVTFIHILRNAGLRLGISEIFDAMKVLAVLDMTDRDQVYRGLFAVLVKSRHDEEIFDRAFHAYFVPEEQRLSQMAQFFAERRERDALKEDLVFKDQPMDVSEQDMETYGAISEEDRQKVRDFLSRANNGVNVTEALKPVIEQQIHSILQRHRDVMGFTQIAPLETTGVDEWDAILYDMSRQQGEPDLLMKNIADIKEDEIQDAVVLLRQLARKLATRIGRRYKSSAGRKIVDVRRSLRSGLRYGGVLMDLKYKRRRIQKPNVILLTDISGSMLKYSGFLLEMMMGLSAVLPNIRSYVFAERLQRLDLKTFDIDTFAKDHELGDGTNIHNSLLAFLTECDRILNRKTVLIILSDTKTVEYREAAEQLRYISGKVKEILWLNPLPAEEWLRFVQTKAFLPWVTMVEASSIQSLTRALKDI